jgi:hypothetical protein
MAIYYNILLSVTYYISIFRHRPLGDILELVKLGDRKSTDISATVHATLKSKYVPES